MTRCVSVRDGHDAQQLESRGFTNFLSGSFSFSFQPERQKVSLSLDLNFASWCQYKSRWCCTHCDRLATMDPRWLPVTLHTAGCVDRVSKTARSNYSFIAHVSLRSCMNSAGLTDSIVEFSTPRLPRPPDLTKVQRLMIRFISPLHYKKSVYVYQYVRQSSGSFVCHVCIRRGAAERVAARLEPCDKFL